MGTVSLCKSQVSWKTKGLRILVFKFEASPLAQLVKAAFQTAVVMTDYNNLDDNSEAVMVCQDKLKFLRSPFQSVLHIFIKYP